MRQLIENNKDIAASVEKLERGHDCTAPVIEILVESGAIDCYRPW
jgi:hypothetical protein